jgi:hypothetical protein
MTHTAARVDRDLTSVRMTSLLWLETIYPALRYRIVTIWVKAMECIPHDVPYIVTQVYKGPHPLSDMVHVHTYDPARVTVGGRAEAHEAVCARVERGELP